MLELRRSVAAVGEKDSVSQCRVRRKTWYLGGELVPFLIAIGVWALVWLVIPVGLDVLKQSSDATVWGQEFCPDILPSRNRSYAIEKKQSIWRLARGNSKLSNTSMGCQRSSNREGFFQRKGIRNPVSAIAKVVQSLVTRLGKAKSGTHGRACFEVGYVGALSKEGMVPGGIKRGVYAVALGPKYDAVELPKTTALCRAYGLLDVRDENAERSRGDWFHLEVVGESPVGLWNPTIVRCRAFSDGRKGVSDGRVFSRKCVGVYRRGEMSEDMAWNCVDKGIPQRMEGINDSYGNAQLDTRGLREVHARRRNETQCIGGNGLGTGRTESPFGKGMCEASNIGGTAGCTSKRARMAKSKRRVSSKQIVQDDLPTREIDDDVTESRSHGEYGGLIQSGNDVSGDLSCHWQVLFCVSVCMTGLLQRVVSVQLLYGVHREFFTVFGRFERIRDLIRVNVCRTSKGSFWPGSQCGKSCGLTSLLFIPDVQVGPVEGRLEGSSVGQGKGEGRFMDCRIPCGINIADFSEFSGLGESGDVACLTFLHSVSVVLLLPWAIIGEDGQGPFFWKGGRCPVTLTSGRPFEAYMTRSAFNFFLRSCWSMSAAGCPDSAPPGPRGNVFIGREGLVHVIQGYQVVLGSEGLIIFDQRNPDDNNEDSERNFNRCGKESDGRKEYWSSLVEKSSGIVSEGLCWLTFLFIVSMGFPLLSCLDANDENPWRLAQVRSLVSEADQGSPVGGGSLKDKRFFLVKTVKNWTLKILSSLSGEKRNRFIRSVQEGPVGKFVVLWIGVGSIGRITHSKLALWLVASLRRNFIARIGVVCGLAVAEIQGGALSVITSPLVFWFSWSVESILGLSGQAASIIRVDALLSTLFALTLLLTVREACLELVAMRVFNEREGNKRYWWPNPPYQRQTGYDRKGRGKGGGGKAGQIPKVSVLKHIAEAHSEGADQFPDGTGSRRGVRKSNLDFQDEQKYHLDKYEPYDPMSARCYEDIVKFFKVLYPTAPRSEIFDVCVGIHEMSPGHTLRLGTGSNGAVNCKPREGCVGPDLSKVDKSARREVFLGCFPTTALEIIMEGVRGRLTEVDFERQLAYDEKRNPMAGVYVSKYKHVAAQEPWPQSWSEDGKVKLGERLAADDSPPLFCVLQGQQVLWDQNGESTVLWEEQEGRDGAGVVNKQQWLVRPEAIHFQYIHFFVAKKSVLTRPVLMTLQKEMKWNDDEFERRKRRGQECIGISDIPGVQPPAPPPNFARVSKYSRWKYAQKSREYRAGRSRSRSGERGPVVLCARRAREIRLVSARDSKSRTCKLVPRRESVDDAPRLKEKRGDASKTRIVLVEKPEPEGSRKKRDLKDKRKVVELRERYHASRRDRIGGPSSASKVTGSKGVSSSSIDVAKESRKRLEAQARQKTEKAEEELRLKMMRERDPSPKSQKEADELSLFQKIAAQMGYRVMKDTSTSAPIQGTAKSGQMKQKRVPKESVSEKRRRLEREEVDRALDEVAGEEKKSIEVRDVQEVSSQEESVIDEASTERDLPGGRESDESDDESYETEEEPGGRDLVDSFEESETPPPPPTPDKKRERKNPLIKATPKDDQEKARDENKGNSGVSGEVKGIFKEHEDEPDSSRGTSGHLKERNYRQAMDANLSKDNGWYGENHHFLSPDRISLYKSKRSPYTRGSGFAVFFAKENPPRKSSTYVLLVLKSDGRWTPPKGRIREHDGFNEIRETPLDTASRVLEDNTSLFFNSENQDITCSTRAVVDTNGLHFFVGEIGPEVWTRDGYDKCTTFELMEREGEPKASEPHLRGKWARLDAVLGGDENISHCNRNLIHATFSHYGLMKVDEANKKADDSREHPVGSEKPLKKEVKQASRGVRSKYDPRERDGNEPFAHSRLLPKNRCSMPWLLAAGFLLESVNMVSADLITIEELESAPGGSLESSWPPKVPPPTLTDRCEECNGPVNTMCASCKKRLCNVHRSQHHCVLGVWQNHTSGFQGITGRLHSLLLLVPGGREARTEDGGRFEVSRLSKKEIFMGPEDQGSRGHLEKVSSEEIHVHSSRELRDYLENEGSLPSGDEKREDDDIGLPNSTFRVRLSSCLMGLFFLLASKFIQSWMISRSESSSQVHLRSNSSTARLGRKQEGYTHRKKRRDEQDDDDDGGDQKRMKKPVIIPWHSSRLCDCCGVQLGALGPPLKCFWCPHKMGHCCAWNAIPGDVFDQRGTWLGYFHTCYCCRDDDPEVDQGPMGSSVSSASNQNDNAREWRTEDFASPDEDDEPGADPRTYFSGIPPSSRPRHRSCRSREGPGGAGREWTQEWKYYK